jgi:hypothetical protein
MLLWSRSPAWHPSLRCRRTLHVMLWTRTGLIRVSRHVRIPRRTHTAHLRIRHTTVHLASAGLMAHLRGSVQRGLLGVHVRGRHRLSVSHSRMHWRRLGLRWRPHLVLWVAISSGLRMLAAGTDCDGWRAMNACHLGMHSASGGWRDHALLMGLLSICWRYHALRMCLLRMLCHGRLASLYRSACCHRR